MIAEHSNKSSVEDHQSTATKAWISVVRAYNECTATLTQQLEPFGLSVLQHEILVNLLEAPGLTQQHLAKRCFSAKSGVSMLVSSFEHDGMIERTKSVSDSRAWSLSLTKKGVALAVDVQKVQQSVVSRMASTYTLEDLRFLSILMDESSQQLQTMRTSNTT